jgi:hypothetical protein
MSGAAGMAPQYRAGKTYASNSTMIDRTRQGTILALHFCIKQSGWLGDGLCAQQVHCCRT